MAWVDNLSLSRDFRGETRIRAAIVTPARANSKNKRGGRGPSWGRSPISSCSFNRLAFRFRLQSVRSRTVFPMRRPDPLNASLRFCPCTLNPPCNRHWRLPRTRDTDLPSLTSFRRETDLSLYLQG